MNQQDGAAFAARFLEAVQVVYGESCPLSEVRFADNTLYLKSDNITVEQRYDITAMLWRICADENLDLGAEWQFTVQPDFPINYISVKLTLSPEGKSQ